MIEQENQLKPINFNEGSINLREELEKYVFYLFLMFQFLKLFGSCVVQFVDFHVVNLSMFAIWSFTYSILKCSKLFLFLQVILFLISLITHLKFSIDRFNF